MHPTPDSVAHPKPRVFGDRVRSVAIPEKGVVSVGCSDVLGGPRGSSGGPRGAPGGSSGGPWEAPKTEKVFVGVSGEDPGGLWGDFGRLEWSLGPTRQVQMLIFRWFE